VQVWKRKWFILRRKSWQGDPRLEYHKSEESCLTIQSKTVVDLKSILKVEPCCSKSRMVSFKLIFNDTFIILSCDSENSMKEWMKMIKKLVLPDTTTIPRVHTEAGKNKRSKFWQETLHVNVMDDLLPRNMLFLLLYLHFFAFKNVKC